MGDSVIIGYIILGLVFALVATYLIVFFTWGRKVRFPEGNRTEFKHNEFKAILFVDNSVEFVEGEFLYNDKKINRSALAKACALSMEAVDYTLKVYGPKNLQSNKKLKECVFVFLPEEKYYKKMKDIYGYTIKSAGFSANLDYNLSNKVPKPYVCYMDMEYMLDTVNTGLLATHEYIHCYSEYVTGDWDAAHAIWEIKTEDGKKLQNIAIDRVKAKLELDNRL